MSNLRFLAFKESMGIVDLNSSYMGLPTSILMENAGRNVAEEISKRVDVKGRKVVVFCGTGNNGGDGFVAARHLAVKGARVKVILIGEPGKIRTEEAKMNWEVVSKMFLTVERGIVRDSSDLSMLSSLKGEADILVDAMLGTGLKGPVREPFLSAIKFFNECKGFKVAVDTPSGLNPDTGEVHGESVKADLTVTMHVLKEGFKGASEYTGEVVVAELGCPLEANVYTGPGDVVYTVKSRDKWSHKGDNGRVLVVGGGDGYSGAPALAALAALRVGVDLAVVYAPEHVSTAIRSYSPNLIVRNYNGGNLNMEAVEEIVEALNGFDSIVIGPGLGLKTETISSTVELVSRVVKRGKPLLVNADGLKALKGELEVVKGSCTVLTPHGGEYRFLFKETLPGFEKIDERIERVRLKAKEYNLTFLLKGHVDIITDGERVKLNFTGNPGMTVGGTGDVLSGVTAAFLAWTRDPFRASVAGAFINGEAGDLAVEEKGYHITATDLIEKIPFAMKRYDKG